jgi:hypothetical protein
MLLAALAGALLGVMNKRFPWYDPNVEKSRLLAALDQVRRLRNNAEEVMPCARWQYSLQFIEAIQNAIGDYAECEMQQREYFWGRPHSTIAPGANARDHSVGILRPRATALSEENTGRA